MSNFDISNHPITIECPNCHFKIDVLLKQVIAEEIIICPGCRNNIKLVDEGGSTRRANQEIKSAIRKLIKH
jgi:Zn finger protein HypA/HybF involved in hydrogenase expression